MPTLRCVVCYLGCGVSCHELRYITVAATNRHCTNSFVMLPNTVVAGLLSRHVKVVAGQLSRHVKVVAAQLSRHVKVVAASV